MIRAVRRLPDPVLATRSAEVDPADQAVVALAVDLVETMRASPGCVGLAAPQVGVPARLCCVDVTGHRKAVSCAGLVILANPVLVEAVEPLRAREGCLSVPDFTGDVVRAGRVVISGARPGDGAPLTVEADAIEARALLHELDHLEGLLFLDRLAHARRDLHARRRYL